MSLQSDPRVRFLTLLGRALHGYGIPSHRLEAALGNAARRLGIQAEFLSTPTSLISSFGDAGDQYLTLARVHPGSLQLDKLVALDDVVESLYRGDLSVEDADRRLRAIVERPARYAAWAHILAFAVASSSAAAFFGGGWPDMAAAFGLGLVGGVLGWAAGRWEAMGRTYEFLFTFLAAFGAAALARLAGPLNVATVIIGSIVVLLPGLTLTLALNELGTGHLVAGTARLTGSLMTFLQIGLGVGLGTRLGHALPGAVITGATEPVRGELISLLLLVTALALTVLFRARPREIPWLMGGALLAFWGARGGVVLLGAGLGAGVGALLVGLAGNLYARFRRRPAVVVIVPSIIVLVPGSIGYRSFEFMLEKDVLSGVDSAFTALLVGCSLVAGLLLANVVVPPRNAL
ncbi:MAG TPA: threonine/serine exporter family protein [Candidatus Krumholzibacteria bacterium]|nr:threonine/serine exporter family protein [Candidatus Krumholzibacteria bacterium]